MPRTLFVVALVIFATSQAFAAENGLKCEAQKYTPQSQEISLVCPPQYTYSPIRVYLTVTKIDRLGWNDLALTAAQPVTMIEAAPDQVLLLLPHQTENRHFLAWRSFSEIKRISISNDKIR